MKNLLFAAACTLGIGSMLHAQEVQKSNRVDQLALGPGVGGDYGGLGANVIFYPQENIGVFGGVGYALAGVGYNAGIKLRLMTRRGVDPYLLAMYGYNAGFVVKGASEYNKLFYGPSVGAGIDVRSKKPVRTGYWSFAVLVPLRSENVENYEGYLNNKGIDFGNELLPVGISIGYHFILL